MTKRRDWPAELPTAAVVVGIDTREQAELPMDPLPSVRMTLRTGDYTLAAMPDYVAVERKGDDLISCCGPDRDRFMEQMKRLRGYPVRMLVLEHTWAAIEMGQWLGKVKPASVIGTLLRVAEMGIPVITAGSHQRAGQLVSRFLYLTAKRRYLENRELFRGLAEGEVQA